MYWFFGGCGCVLILFSTGVTLAANAADAKPEAYGERF